MQRNIFISYARRDSDYAEWAYYHLTNLGHNCWLDQQLDGGDDWWHEILSNIAASDLFLPLVSLRFKRSEACKKEVDYATSLRLPSIPLQVDDEVGRQNELGHLQWVDVRARDEHARDELLRAVTRADPRPLAPSPMPDPPAAPVSAARYIRQHLAQRELDRDLQEWVLSIVENAIREGEEEQDLLEVLDELGRDDNFFKALEGRRQYLINTIHGQMRGEVERPPAELAYADTAPPPLPQPAVSGGGGNALKIVLWAIGGLFVLAIAAEACAPVICDPYTGFCA